MKKDNTLAIVIVAITGILILNYMYLDKKHIK
jgi:hypothetical protein